MADLAEELFYAGSCGLVVRRAVADAPEPTQVVPRLEGAGGGRLAWAMKYARIIPQWALGAAGMGLWEGCGGATAVQGGGACMGVRHGTRTGLRICGSCGVRMVMFRMLMAPGLCVSRVFGCECRNASAGPTPR